LFLDIAKVCNVAAPRGSKELAFHIIGIKMEPGHNSAPAEFFKSFLYDHHAFALFPNADFIFRFYKKRRNVYPFSVYRDMAVKNELPRLASAGSKPEPVNNIVKPPLKKHKKIFAGYSGHAQRPLEKQVKLPFLHSVNPAEFLFFSELHAVIASFSCSSFGILSGSGPLSVYCAFIAFAPFSLEHKFF
jgi:hypothetical protein